MEQFLFVTTERTGEPGRPSGGRSGREAPGVRPEASSGEQPGVLRDENARAGAEAGEHHEQPLQTSRVPGGDGGGLATVVVDPPRGDSQVGLLYEGGVRIRAFIVPSVALTVSAGMSGALYDGNSSVGIGGRPTGSAGILYFF